MKYHIKRPVSEDDFARYFYLRWKLLRAPWQQAEGTEKDDMEESCIHVMAVSTDDVVVGVARLQYNTPTEAQIRYMAVDTNHERLGIGRELVTTLETHASETGHHHIVLDARESAVGFYEKMDYSVIEKSYLLFDDIQHYKMSKSLTST